MYGWRCLEATVGIRLKSKTWEHQKTPDQGTLINKSSFKSLHTYTETKLHPRANKFQSKTYQANSPTTQEHNPEHKNTAKSHTKPTDTSKFTTGHFIALQREEIELHPPEHWCKLPLPGNLDKPLIQPHPQGGTSTIKRNHKLPFYRKVTLNTAT